MEATAYDHIISLDISFPVWDRCFTVAPLVVVGTKEGDHYDLAPKHMVTPLGWDNYFGFVCTPSHSTYHNVKQEKAFTVSFPWPDQTVMASLTATPRRDGEGADNKPVLKELPRLTAHIIDGVFLRDSYLLLECKLIKIVDGFGINSLIAGQIVAAYVHENALRASENEDQELLYHAPLLAYLNPGRFAAIKETYSFPFPADFKK